MKSLQNVKRNQNSDRNFSVAHTDISYIDTAITMAIPNWIARHFWREEPGMLLKHIYKMVHETKTYRMVHETN